MSNPEHPETPASDTTQPLYAGPTWASAAPTPVGPTGTDPTPSAVPPATPAATQAMPRVTAEEVAAPPTTNRRGRVWSLRALAAAAITAVALSGAGGAALAAASDGGSSGGPGGGRGGFGGPPGFQRNGQPGQVQGQLPQGGRGGPPPQAGVPGTLPPATGSRDTDD